MGSHDLRQHPASVEQTPVVGEVDRMAQMPRVELDHRMPEMLAHRVLTDLERIRDRPRPTADGIHAQDLALAISQPAGWQRCVEPFFGRQFHQLIHGCQSRPKQTDASLARGPALCSTNNAKSMARSGSRSRRAYRIWTGDHQKPTGLWPTNLLRACTPTK